MDCFLLKKKYFSSFVFLFLSGFLFNITAQNTSERVYEILQTKCATSGCHNSASQVAGLDLQGSSPTDVYNSVFNVDSQNPTSLSKHNKIVFPGDPYRSTLFRKVAADTEASITLGEGEGSKMPLYGGEQLTDVEREIIRQWILFGAPLTGNVVDETLLETFYNDGEGYWTIDPQDPPPPPTEGEGYQVRVGPIFLPPSTSSSTTEIEFYSKYETFLPATEITQIDFEIGSSHHFIIYDFEDDATNRPYGFRTNANHSNVGYVTGVQESTNFKLPEGTAYRWQENVVLDLNPHVINFSQSQVMATDVYVNIYTQEDGTAAQEMHSALLVNTNLFIPSDGEEHSFETPINLSWQLPSWLNEIYIWQMSSHAHARATGFHIWLQNEDGSKGEYLYDGSKYNGIPDCEDIGYDYQHPPARTFGDFLTLNLDNSGLIHQATYINNTGNILTWGNTSEDEMMITAVNFVTSKNGIEVMPEASVCQNEENEPEPTTDIDELILEGDFTVDISPNPIFDKAEISIGGAMGMITFRMYNMMGDLVLEEILPPNINGLTTFTIDASSFPNGTYVYTAMDSKGNSTSGKVMVK